CVRLCFPCRIACHNFATLQPRRHFVNPTRRRGAAFCLSTCAPRRNSLIFDCVAVSFDDWGSQMKLNYVIKFVDDMDRAVKFHRDVLGLSLKFDFPEWSEFETGETTLALHRASAKNAAGTVELGFTVPDLHKFYA